MALAPPSSAWATSTSRRSQCAGCADVSASASRAVDGESSPATVIDTARPNAAHAEATVAKSGGKERCRTVPWVAVVLAAASATAAASLARAPPASLPVAAS